MKGSSPMMSLALILGLVVFLGILNIVEKGRWD